MSLLDSIGNLFVYKSPKPLEGETFQRYHLMGLSNKKLNELLGKNPHIHCKKIRLVELILAEDR